jgi:hypothetical protein
LVLGASLANVLDDDQSRLALADAVDEDLVGPAGINSYTPLKIFVVGVSIGANCASAVDAIESIFTIAKAGIEVELFVDVAAVAMVVVAGFYLCGGGASETVLCDGRGGQQQ